MKYNKQNKYEPILVGALFFVYIFLGWPFISDFIYYSLAFSISIYFFPMRIFLFTDIRRNIKFIIRSIFYSLAIDFSIMAVFTKNTFLKEYKILSYIITGMILTYAILYLIKVLKKDYTDKNSDTTVTGLLVILIITICFFK